MRAVTRVGLDWRDHVTVDEALWRPAVSFAALVDLLVDAALGRAGDAATRSP